MPIPCSPAFVGLARRHLAVDLAVYDHVVMSMYKRGIGPAADLSLSLHF